MGSILAVLAWGGLLFGSSPATAEPMFSGDGASEQESAPASQDSTTEASPATTRPAGSRPADSKGVAIVPDDFLRSWDPITVFFDRDIGPAGADSRQVDPQNAGRFFELQPAHPGVLEWLDRRTLRFRPVDPWPALSRFEVRALGSRERLATLMAKPVKTVPADGSEGLEAVETITLAFAEPIDPTALARALTLELRPLPGVDASAARWLDRQDFDIKVLERAKRSDAARYVLTLHRQLPLGQRVLVHLQLALDPLAGKSSGRVTILDLSTAEPFRAVALGCGRASFPVAPAGSRYSREQAIRCDSSEPEARVGFSAPLGELDPIAARNLLRLSPAVDNLEWSVAGEALVAKGSFARDRLYQLSLSPAAVIDLQGRSLEEPGSSEVWIYFPSQAPYLEWGAGQGWVERLGPQTVPAEGRGDRSFDLRIHPIPATDRSFWPFPEEPVILDEGLRPPGPGEEPQPFRELWRWPTPQELGQQLRRLGTPTVSTLEDLPFRSEGAGAASFGLDLGPTLEAAFGARQAGTYLVGLRRLDGDTRRSWMRLQVTDLALSTFEEPHRVVFVVTSLASAEPVSGATVRVEGAMRPAPGEMRWGTIFQGVTDARGWLVWDAPGKSLGGGTVRRLQVRKGDDVLVLDPTRAPDHFRAGHWNESIDTWLQWTQEELRWRGPLPKKLAHVFTERPVYRPEEVVHLTAFLRSRERGRLRPLEERAFVVIAGPGGREWRYPATPSAAGTVYLRFEAEDTPAGVYRARIEVGDPEGGEEIGQVTFRKEAYRLPRFEVLLSGSGPNGSSGGPASLDRPFEVHLAATYYAGGRVAQRPVRWRVTQFPYLWRPRAREGFVFSSDGRYSRTAGFESTPSLDRQDTTDDDGGAVLEIDPSIEPTAQPRTYVVEATVTGADDQTVTATRRVVALSPFLLGLKAPRFLEPGQALRPEVLVIGPDEEPLAGQEVTVRLLHRQWHSHLRASDFSDGVARYVTDVVDELVHSTEITSTEEALAVELPIAEPGVYVVELESRDRLGRAQVLAVDLYAAGDGQAQVAWDRPSSRVLEVSTDAAKYRPGQTARLVFHSPFRSARALVVVEAPDANRYHWVEVRGGEGTFSLPIEGHWTPKIPVHVVLMRGRLEGTGPRAGNAMDLGKPVTLAATNWIEVEPEDLRLQTELEHVEESMPGREIEVTVRLSTPDGEPAPGEVALWLVDRAVLALGKEQRLDPVADFNPAHESYLEARDTRSLVFGDLPYVELPGGGEGASERGVLDRQTVRRNFRPVPFFEPSIPVGPEGEVRVKILLPDNLTDFAVRAKAVSGDQRFGYAKSRLAVRLPVIVQPALPRFLRPGDRFLAGAVARLVSGDPGPGTVEARFEGVEVEGGSGEEASATSLRRDIQWLPNRPVRLDFPLRVPSSPVASSVAPGAETAEGSESLSVIREAIFRIGAERTTDGAGDAFEVRLPILDDRRPTVRRQLVELEAGESFEWAAIDEPVRPGSVSRNLLVAARPALIRMAAGLEALMEYPYGCTEQRLSRARAQLALEDFRQTLQSSSHEVASRAVEETLQWVEQTLGDDGLVAYWPGGRGYVSLTAWVGLFLAEAREAGFEVSPELRAPIERALKQALRSDSTQVVDGAAWTERVMALEALSRLGSHEASYAAELGRKAQFLVTEDVARLLLALQAAGTSDDRPELEERLWESVIFRLERGVEVYAGLVDEPRRSPLVLPSETRTLAEATRALVGENRQDPRLDRLVDALLRLGGGDGWGSTQADAAALLALAEVSKPAAPAPAITPAIDGSGAESGDPAGTSAEDLGSRESRAVNVVWPGEEPVELRVGPDRPLAQTSSDSEDAVQVSRSSASDAKADTESSPGSAVLLRAETRYLAAAAGSEIEAKQEGFVVERTWRIQGTAPNRIVDHAAPRQTRIEIGTVVEEHIRLISAKHRTFVAVIVPLAAGMEAMNPALATAPREAAPEGRATVEPTYADFRDDHVAFYFDQLPKGTHDLYFRSRAATVGSFIQPPARAEAMYEASDYGHSAGARIDVERSLE